MAFWECWFFSILWRTWVLGQWEVSESFGLGFTYKSLTCQSATCYVWWFLLKFILGIVGFIQLLYRLWKRFLSLPAVHPHLPLWVFSFHLSLESFGLISLFTVVDSYPMLSAKTPRWPDAYHNSTSVVHLILLVFFFFVIVKVIIFMRGHGSIDKIVHLPFSSWFWNAENFNIFWSERNMVYGSMCLAFFSALFWGGK